MVGHEDKRENRMYSSTLAKWSGPAAVLAGLMFGVWGYFNVAEIALSTVVPLLSLLALTGLRDRCVGQVGWLGEAGFILGFAASIWGGLIRHFVDMTALYKYFVREGWPPWLSNWFVWLVISLIVIGLAATKNKASRGYGMLSLKLGAFGWLFFSTNSRGVIETHLGHLAFGAFFCLSWMALGYALWKDIGQSDARSYLLNLQEQVRAVRSLVSSFVASFRG